ncbi:MAG TPA: crossover junction endodeoxyribonuclease RuvC [Sulfurimonas sp. UBA12504]|nr:MAG TPA: crossover junction endodeoxyribonuclease RuvC [Sulfurimonas sp. UBA12504]
MIILSIDSGIERTGYAIFENSKYVTSALIFTNKKRKTAERFQQIYLELEKIVKKFKPSVIVLEKLFFFKNQKTIVMVGQAQGVILLLAAQYHIEALFLTPPQIKQIVTGYGQSDKKNIQKMLRLSLGLSQELEQDDRADAIATAFAYCCMKKNLLDY